MKTRRLSVKQFEKNLLGIFESVQNLASKTKLTSWINPTQSSSLDSPNFGSAARNMIFIAFFLLVGFQPLSGSCSGAPIQLSETHTNVLCNGGSTGSIDLTIVNNVSTYTYAWSGPSSYTATTEDITGLAIGTYTVTVTDANLSTTTSSVTITEPAAALSVSVSASTLSCNTSTTTATAIPTGGTAAYIYLWTGGQTTATATGLSAGSYTVSVTDANSCTATSSVTISNPTHTAGTAWYVNDNSTVGDTYTTAVGNNSNIGTASCPLATLAQAITLASAGEVIYVDAGSYAANVTVNKTVNVLGPNYNVSPNTGTRVAEAILMPATTNTASGAVVTITSSNVQFMGFTVDGDNPSLASSGVGLGGSLGTSIDAARTIFLNGNGLTGVTISNNIAKNAVNGIRIEQTTNYFATTANALFSYGHWINDNKVQDMTGTGIRLGNSMYAKVTNNSVTNVDNGIAFSSFRISDAGSAADRVISGNTISSRYAGIWVNLFHASPYAITNNTITPAAAATSMAPTPQSRTAWYGIMYSTVSAPQNFSNQTNLPLVASPEWWTCTNNTIDGGALESTSTGYGYWFYYVDNNRDNNGVDHFGQISGGSVSNVDVGIMLKNKDTDPSTNFGNSAVGAHANVSGTSFSLRTGGTGFRLIDDATWVTGNPAPLVNKRTVALGIGAGVSISGGSTGINISHPVAGTANYTAYNSITSGALNNISFSGQSGDYISLSNHPNGLDATTASFDGNVGSSASLAQNYAIEGKISHKVDNATRGLVRVKASNIYVTASNTVQAGIDAATAADIVNVAEGTYVESVTVNKSVSMVGSNAGVLGCGTRVGESVINGNFGTAVTISANGASVDGFRLIGATGVSSTGYSATVINNKVEALGVGLSIAGVSSGYTSSGNCITMSSQAVGTTPTVGIALSAVSGTTPALLNNNTISGAYYGYILYAVNTSTASTVSGGSITGVKQGVAVFNLNPQTLTGYLPTTATISGISMSGFTGNHTGASFANNNFHAGVYSYTEGSDANAKLMLTLNNLTIDGTGKIAPNCAGIMVADFSTGSGNRQTVTANNCILTNNLNRGANARGTNALFEINGSTLTGNGSDPFGTGGNIGFGIQVSTGASANVSNNYITNPSTVAMPYQVYALSFGNAPSGTITATNNSFDNNGNANGYLLSNNSGVVNATCNWWGNASSSAVATAAGSATTYSPWLIAGTDDNNSTNGFQPQAPCIGVAVTLSETHVNVDCKGNSTASIDLTVNTGVGPYSYLWSNNATTEDLSGLILGTYTVTVTDASGSTATTSVTITEPAAITGSGAVTSNYNGAQLSCATATDGEITVTASGGTGSLTYSIDGGSYQSSAVFTGLAAGVHTLSVKDANGCLQTPASVTITAPSAITGSGAVTSNYNGSQLNCATSTDGVITVTANGGTGTLTYSIDGGTYQLSNVFTGLAAGVHTLSVKDANGCLQTPASVTITAPAGITGSGAVTSTYNGSQLSCATSTDGTITVTANGGTVSLTYSIDGGTYQSSNVFTGLGAGVHTLSVKDVNGCTKALASVTITAPTTILISGAVTSDYNGAQLSCNGLSNGEITITASQGTGTLTYSVDGGAYQSSNVFTGLGAGSHSITAKDANGCTSSSSVTITAPTSLSVTVGSNTPQYAGATVNLTSTVLGGVSGYTYSWSGPNGFTSTSANPSISNVTTAANGSYTVVVTDANNCTATSSVSVIVYGTELYVNDNSTSGDVYTSAIGNDNNSGTANAPFATIGKAIQVAQAGNTIKVDAGTFTENITVSKSLSILGANAVVNPNTGTRNAETVLVPSVNDPSAGRLINLQANNVVISGFTLDGDNPSLSGGTTIINGADANTARALNNKPAATNGLTFENNIVRNFTLTGVYLFPDGTQPNSSFNYIRYNHFVNMHFRGIYMQNEVDAEISNNVFTNVHTGIAISSVGTASASGFTPRISNNTINLVHTGSTTSPNRHMGISVNHRYNSASDLLIENNTINAGSSILTRGEGIRMTSAVFGGGIKATNNVINGNNKLTTGYWVWNTDNQSDVSITGGSVSGIQGRSIAISNYDSAYAAYSYSSGNYVTIDNVAITTTTNGNGVCGYNFSNANPGDVYITLKNNTTIGGSGTGVLLNGARVNLAFTGTLPATFNSSLANYMQLQNAASTNPANEIDARNVVFGSATAGNSALADNFLTEDKIAHKLDDSSLGLVRVKAAELFVTTNSFVSPATTTPNIQRAIDAATAGNVVNVAAGTYEELININKVITLNGPNATVSGAGSRSAEAILEFPSSVANGSSLIEINSNIHGVTIAGFDLRCQDATVPKYLYLISAVKSSSSDATEKWDNMTIKNNRFYSSEVPLYILEDFDAHGSGLLIEGNYVNGGPNVNNSYNRGFYVGGTSGTIQDNTVENCKIGIQYMPYSNPNTGLIRRNTVTASLTGLYHNYQKKGAGSVTWEQNVVSAAPNPQTGLSAQVDGAMTTPTTFKGIHVINFGTEGTGANPSVTFQNNSINAANPGGTTSTVFQGVYLSANSAGNVTLLENSFTNYTEGIVRNSNGDANTTTVNSNCNWWGSSSNSAVTTAASSASTYSPWLTNGTDNSATIGFQPVANSCTGTSIAIASATSVITGCGLGSITVSFSGGTSPYTVALNGESATTYTSGTAITGLTPNTYAIVITDANGSTATASTTVNDYKVNNATAGTWYATIQSAIDAATAGDVINVCAGTYTELINVNKAITLNGPNATVPGTGSRSAEAILEFPSSVANGSSLIEINSNIHGVTIAGFDLRCQDATVPKYLYLISAVKSSSSDATEKWDNMTIKNNRFYSSEVPLYILEDFDAHGSGLLIEGNYVNGGPNVNNSYNRGFYVGGTSGTIQDNTVENCKIGIQYMPYSNPNTGLIRRNTVTASLTGLYHNYQKKGAGSVTWEQNVVSAAPNPQTGLSAQVDGAMTTPTTFKGIHVINFGTEGTGANPSVTFQNNSINAANPGGTTSTVFQGVYLSANSAGNVTLLENSFTNYTEGIVRNSNGDANTTTVNSNCNWWGSSSNSAVTTAASSASTYSPWLTNGTDNSATIGFQPVANSCTGTSIAIASATSAITSCGVGSITVSFSGGTSPYTVALNGGSATTYTSGTAITGLTANTYAIVITDANGSTAATSASIVLQYVQVAISVDGTNALPATAGGGSTTICANAAYAMTLLSITQGTGPVTFLYNVRANDINGAILQSNVSSGAIAAGGTIYSAAAGTLSAGTYFIETLSITDNLGCQVQPAVMGAGYYNHTLVVLPAVQVAISVDGTNALPATAGGGSTTICANAAYAMTLLSITQGTGPVTFLYNVRANDINGAILQSNVSSGAIAAGGTIYSAAAGTLSAGTYFIETLSITDNLGCQVQPAVMGAGYYNHTLVVLPAVQVAISVDGTNALPATAGGGSTTICANAAYAMTLLSITQGTGPVTFLYNVRANDINGAILQSNVSSGAIAAGGTIYSAAAGTLSAGTYFIETLSITDNLGCQVQPAVMGAGYYNHTLVVLPAVQVAISVDGTNALPATAGGGSTTICANAAYAMTLLSITQGTGPVTFLYNVRANDINGAILQSNVSSGAIAAGGTIYSAAAGTLSAGTYFIETLSITDNLGCQVQPAVMGAGYYNHTLVVLPAVQVAISVDGTNALPATAGGGSTTICANAAYAMTLLSITQGTGPVTFLYNVRANDINGAILQSNVSSGAIAAGGTIYSAAAGTLSAGTYFIETLSITDANGCQVQPIVMGAGYYNHTLVVLPAVQVAISVDGTNALPATAGGGSTTICANAAYAMTLLSITQGTGPVTFLYNVRANDINGAILQSNVSSGAIAAGGTIYSAAAGTLSAGTYFIETLSITDANGCQVQPIVMGAGYYNHTLVVLPAVQVAISVDGTNALPATAGGGSTTICANAAYAMTLLSITQGTGPVTFLYNVRANDINGAILQSNVSSGAIAAGGTIYSAAAGTLSAGTYFIETLSITDANGCQVQPIE
ncbi:serine-rich adhesin for platelets [Filimonas sp.]|nr:serine-rich adhesin for platelets [Filimonas sp.]